MSAPSGVASAAMRMVGDLFKYGLASVAALALDYGLLLFCHQSLGLPYPIAAAIGFSSGLALVYLTSIWFVFEDRRSIRPGLEFAAFVAIGVAGLLLTEALLHLFVERLGLTPAIAKIPTAGFVFLFNFSARRSLLFSSPPPGAKPA